MPSVSSRFSTPVVLVMMTLALAGCKSPEERAEEYFQSAQALIAEGDVDRALIELRNVFQNDGFHQAARQTYADLLMERGNTQEAFSQYLRLLEQYPDTPQVRLVVSELAVQGNNWEAVERHGRPAMEMLPDDPRAQAIGLVLAYRDAVLDESDDSEAVQSAGVAINAALEASPENLVLLRFAIDFALKSEDPVRALALLEAAIALDPENFEYHRSKLQVLQINQDIAGVQAQLETMIALFPTVTELKTALLQLYIQGNNLDAAEAFLRAEADAAPSDETANDLDVVQFLLRYRDRDVARAELSRLVEANADTPQAAFFASFLAGMDFEEGRRDEAFAALDEILAGADPSDETRRIMVIKARLLNVVERVDEAKANVDRVLAEDPTQVGALKLRAGWLIAEDKPGEAILTLRTAQSQASRDPEIMTLLASAFERDGSMDLASEQLSQAVVASNAGVEESLRYAQFLRGQGRLTVADSILRDALRASGGNLQVLAALSDLLIAQEEWPEVMDIAANLRASENAAAGELAKRLEAAVLLGQGQLDEGMEMLAAQAEASAGDLRPTVTLVLTQIRAGKIEEARAVIDTELEAAPDNQLLRLLRANTDVLLGNLAEAETELRVLVEEAPLANMPVRLLFGVLQGQGRDDEARAVLESGIERQPENAQLKWMQASFLERDGDFDGAIALYESMYANNSGDVIVANNLASMLSTYRTDEESLNRAHAIARRLRAQNVPAFQDTYGWIEYRRGNLEDARPFLEAGAAGLPQDPIAQFHLGMLYADLGRTEQAMVQFERMMELVGTRDLPQVAVARERMAALAAAAANPEAGTDAGADQ